MVSPSGDFTVFPSVDARNKNSRNYGIVMLHLAKTSGEAFPPVRTGAGDVQKWAVGWMPEEDIVVLYSSDIGTLAYKVEDAGLVRIAELSDEIHSRANELYATKYNRAAPSLN